MFYGNNQLKIDVKGRIAIPTRYREHLMNQYGQLLVITPNVFELSREDDKTIIQCLRMYPAKLWRLIASKASSYGAKAAYEYMIEHAQESEMDAQGQVLLHPVLRAEVRYEQHLQIVGKIDHFDLWREDFWEAHKKKQLSRAMSDRKKKKLKMELHSIDVQNSSVLGQGVVDD